MGRALWAARLLLALAILGLIGLRCGDGFEFRGVLGQPISLRAESDLPLVPVRIDDDERWRWTLLDVGSPITLVPIQGPAQPSETVATVSVLEASTVDGGAERIVTRLEFPGQVVYDYDSDSLDLGTAEPVEGLLGTDLLGRFAVQLRMGEKTFTLFDTVDGSNSDLAEDGWAVFPGVFEGGGRKEAGCESPLPARRLVVQACAFGDDEPDGVDLTLAMSTGVVHVTVGRSAAARLPSAVTRLAVVGDSQSELGACEELAERSADRPGAAAVWVDGPLPWAEISDADPNLVAARAEVGNSTDGVDGFLGTGYLSAIRVILDYPGRRLLIRCENAADCQTIPRSLNR